MESTCILCTVLICIQLFTLIYSYPYIHADADSSMSEIQDDYSDHNFVNSSDSESKLDSSIQPLTL